MLIELPNGFVEGQDWFNYAEIEELKGKQQNYLANRELVVGNLGHISKILEDLVVCFQTKEGVTWKGKISDAISRIPIGDIDTLLVKIREKTFGSRYYYEAECTNCSHLNKNLRIDLDKLEIKKLDIKDLIEEKSITLPKSGSKIVLKPLYLKDLYSLIKISTDKKDKLITEIIALSIKSLNSETKNIAEQVENLSVSDISNLQEQLENVKIEGNIDTDLDITCSKCNKDFKSKINCYDVSFFVHTRGSTN